MAYEIANEQGAVVATGTSVQVMFDYRQQVKARIPDAIRAAIAAVQGGSFGA